MESAIAGTHKGVRFAAGFSPIARGVIVAAALAVLVMSIQAAASLLAPLLLAGFIAVVASPALSWMRRRGIPKWGAVVVIALVLLDAGSILMLLTTGSLEGFLDSLPVYQERFLLLSEQFGGWLERIGVVGSREAVPEFLDPGSAIRLVRTMLANVGDTFATGLLVLLAVVFMLIEAPDLAVRLKSAFDLSPEAEARLQRLLKALNRYMVIKSITSLTTASLIGLWLWILGLDFVILWAILAFLFNFVPFVGTILMMVPAVLLALVQTDLATTLLVAVGYLVVNTLIGSLLEPRVMGRGLGISTLAVFLSLLFWGWVLGTVGVFLSVPLTMAVIVALDASPNTRPIALLLGPTQSSPKPTADPGQAEGHNGQRPPGVT